ncbi:Tumor Necrosis Factor Ligand Superfamily Member 11 [Manis pentadactyla]|nr:Tumor Necrosis Factor Ligand Superfamily Member 11 [Manis pentadactyla]
MLASYSACLFSGLCTALAAVALAYYFYWRLPPGRVLPPKSHCILNGLRPRVPPSGARVPGSCAEEREGQRNGQDGRAQ